MPVIPATTPKPVNRRVPGLYENFLINLNNAGTKNSIKGIIGKAIDAGKQGALNEAEVNSIIRIGNRKAENIYEARGGVHTYKPHLSFGARDIGK